MKRAIWWQPPERARDLREDKLILLYAFKAMGRMTVDEALRFLIEGDFLEFLPAQLALNELIDGHFIAGEGAGSYALTDEGDAALDALSSDVAHSELARIDELAPKYALVFARERHVFADYALSESGEYTAHLGVREGSMTVFEVRISVPEKSQARAMCRAFPARASELYYELIYALSAEEK